MDKRMVILYFIIFLFPTLIVQSGAVFTDLADLSALEDLYTSLNNPTQLVGWKTNGGDPCKESWKGISCFGTSVVFIEISDLGLDGALGYKLSSLTNLRSFDASNNHIHGEIPHQLPQNINHLNLAFNNFSANLPYSIASMGHLRYLNVSHNSLHGSIANLFTFLVNLTRLDLSYNNFNGDLPSSFTSLYNLRKLYLQNNQLSGSVNFLANLPLSDLNIANNRFSGWIPQQFDTIEICVIEGNMFHNNMTRYPPPSPPPINKHMAPNMSHNHPTMGPTLTPFRSHLNGSRHTKKTLSPGAIAGIVVGVTLTITCASLFVHFRYHCHPKEEEEHGDNNDFSFSGSQESLPIYIKVANEGRSEARASGVFYRKNIRPPLSSSLRPCPGRNSGARRPMSATMYSIAELQAATDSFSEEAFLGVGSMGRVYKALFPDGQVFAVKRVDLMVSSKSEEELFLDVVSEVSVLRHPNIVNLVGYCTEFGHYFLVHDYVGGNGSLYDALHAGKLLTWNARIKIAIGAARALQYLHGAMKPIIHKNFKSCNVLLDHDFAPRVSDCGLSLLLPNPRSQGLGYIAPESGICNTEKMDIYSFGVVLLELLTGREPVDRSRSRGKQDLVRWARPRLHDSEALRNLVDPVLAGTYTAKSLSRLADVISICIQPEPEFRPAMTQVLDMLNHTMTPAKPDFDNTSFSTTMTATTTTPHSA